MKEKKKYKQVKKKKKVSRSGEIHLTYDGFNPRNYTPEMRALLVEREVEERREEQERLGPQPGQSLKHFRRPKHKWRQTQLYRRQNSYDGPFQWAPRKVQAARMLASSQYTKDEIAETVGVHPQTIYFWLTHTKFCAVVEKFVFDIGLATEPQRVLLMKKRMHQIDHLIGNRLKLASTMPMEIDPSSTLPQLLSAEQKLLENFERRDKGADATFKFTMDVSPDVKKVLRLEELLKDLPADAKQAVEVSLLDKAREIIEAKQRNTETKEAGDVGKTV